MHCCSTQAGVRCVSCLPHPGHPGLPCCMSVMARPSLPCSLFACACFSADEIDAIGTKRYDAHSGGEREIQRTMLELLNQLDGFDAISDVKVGLVQATRGSRCGQAGS